MHTQSAIHKIVTCVNNNFLCTPLKIESTIMLCKVPRWNNKGRGDLEMTLTQKILPD